MNDSIYRCKLSLYEFDYSEMELSNIVNQVPKGALGYRMPLEAFVILLQQLIPPTISTNGKEELP